MTLGLHVGVRGEYRQRRGVHCLNGHFSYALNHERNGVHVGTLKNRHAKFSVTTMLPGLAVELQGSPAPVLTFDNYNRLTILEYHQVKEHLRVSAIIIAKGWNAPTHVITQVLVEVHPESSLNLELRSLTGVTNLVQVGNPVSPELVVLFLIESLSSHKLTLVSLAVPLGQNPPPPKLVIHWVEEEVTRSLLF